MGLSLNAVRLAKLSPIKSMTYEIFSVRNVIKVRFKLKARNVFAAVFCTEQVACPQDI